jgi:AraC-like DNA-binding protein
MNEYNMLNIIALIAIFVSVLLTLFLLTVKSKNRLANILLAGFIIFCAVDISGVFSGQILKNQPVLSEFFESFTFLIFPLFYYYVLAISYNNFKLKFKDLFHALPFTIYNVLFLFTIMFAKHESLVFTLHKIAPYIIKIQGLFYLIAIIYVLRKYKKVYLENYANGNIKIYKWLSRIVLLFLITFPATIIKDFSHFYNHQEIFIWTITALTGSALIMFTWFILKALYNPEIFRGIDPEIKPVKAHTSSNVDSKSIETDLDTKNIVIIEQLRKYMIEKEPFLEPTLTLQDLALQMNIHARELSILINRHIGQHFFDFINKYRIEKAIEIIEKSSIKEFTIQQILFDVGFNSKSSFNTAFRKHTGLTPTEYRNKHT